MPTTLRDVAAMAGVSISTVSRALNGDQDRPVALETRQRIWEVVRQLRYEPNDAAQRLVRRVQNEVKRTYSVGLILGEVSYKFSDPFWSVVLDGVDEELIRQEYHLRFAMSIDDLQRRSHRHLLSNAHVDGLILLGGVRAITEDLGKAISLDHAVMVDGSEIQGHWHEKPPTEIIAIEKRRVIYRVVDHLVALGRRRLGFLGPAPTADERAEAFFHALGRHNLPFEANHCLLSPWSAEGAYEVAKTLLAGENPPDALVCGCDTIAIGAMRAAKECGLRLPHDLAITGFDDIAFARDLDPPLTTVHVPKELVGELAVRALMERIKHPERPPIVHLVPTTLVVRSSCGARGDAVDATE